MKRVRRIKLTRDRRGVGAVEFALVSMPFILLLLGVIAISLDFYFQQVLDLATQKAARQVQLGAVPATYTQSDFVKNVLCPAFGQLGSCANVYVDLRPVINYQTLLQPNVADAPTSTGTTGLSYCVGKPGQLMYLHVVFLAPTLNALFGVSQAAGALVSNVAFANENPSGATAVSSNGC